MRGVLGSGDRLIEAREASEGLQILTLPFAVYSV